MSWEELEFFVQIRDIYISKKMLKFAREKIKKKVKLELEQIETSNNARKDIRVSKLNKKDDEVSCNVRWPVCLDAIESSKERKRANSFFIYRASQLPVTIEHNHFARKAKKPIDRRSSPFEGGSNTQTTDMSGDKARDSGRTPEKRRVNNRMEKLFI